MVEGEQGKEKPYDRKEYLLPEGISIGKTFDSRGERVDGDEFQLFFYPAGNSSGGEIFIKGKRKKPYHVKVNFITGLVDASG